MSAGNFDIQRRDAGPHSIYRKPVLPTNSTEYILAQDYDDEGGNDKSEPTGKVERDGFWMYSLNVVTVLPPVMFLILGLLALGLDQLPESDYGNRIMRVLLLVPSIYPIMFTALLARCLRNVGLQMAQRGTTLGKLEQIFSSVTLGGTIASAFFFGAFNITFFFLLIVWALSPLGGQAGLRIVSLESLEFSRVPKTIWYRSSDDSPELEYANVARIEVRQDIASLYQSHLYSAEASLSLPWDTYGNLRIPMMERLDGYKADTDGWITLPSSGDVVWSSISGIPYQSASTDGNGTFTIESSYTYLNCSQPYNVTLSELPNRMFNHINTSFYFPTRKSARTLFLDMTEDGYKNGRSMNLSAAQVPRQLSFVSIFDDMYPLRSAHTDPDGFGTVSMPGPSYSYSTCTALQTYVESLVGCSDASCGVIAVRESQHNHLPRHISPLDGRPFNITDNDATYQFFSEATMPEPSGTWGYSFATTTERYIEDPKNPWKRTGISPDFTQLSAETFSTRFTTAYNTYFNVFKGPVPAVLIGTEKQLEDITNPTPDYAEGYDKELDRKTAYLPGQFGYWARPANNASAYLARQTKGIWTKNRPTYVCHWQWVAVYFVSVSSLMLVTFVGFGVSIKRKTPDFLMTITGALRDSQYIDDNAKEQLAGSWKDAAITVRDAWDVKVGIRDVKSTEQVGRIALVAGEDGNWGPLKARKTYE